MPIKRLIIDEAQNVNKRDGVRHRAIKALYAHSIVLPSGTLAHNKWYNLPGVVDFLKTTLSRHILLSCKSFGTFGLASSAGYCSDEVCSRNFYKHSQLRDRPSF